MKKIGILFLNIFFLTSCVSNSKNETQDVYFYDIKGFFKADAIKLSKENPTVNKTIIYNKKEESHSLKIENWEQELALFTESDINKSSWRNSYKVDSSENKIVYTALEEKLKTRKIEIDLENQVLKKIKFKNYTSNYLYTSEETLEYYPDSLYIINKNQKVILLGNNEYLITGKINN